MEHLHVDTQTHALIVALGAHATSPFTFQTQAPSLTMYSK